MYLAGGADEGVAGGAVPGDVPRLLPDYILRRQDDGYRTSLKHRCEHFIDSARFNFIHLCHFSPFYLFPGFPAPLSQGVNSLIWGPATYHLIPVVGALPQVDESSVLAMTVHAIYP